VRKKSDIVGDALLALEGASLDPELREELEELHLHEVATEAAISGAPSLDGLPVFLVTLARTVTTVPPMGGEANAYTVTRPAVLIVRPDEQRGLKGISDHFTREDLLPRDQGLRVASNWKIVNVLDCEAKEEADDEE
jgi:hypothetical protein